MEFMETVENILKFESKTADEHSTLRALVVACRHSTRSASLAEKFEQVDATLNTGANSE